jgi:hypothetical protein
MFLLQSIVETVITPVLAATGFRTKLQAEPAFEPLDRRHGFDHDETLNYRHAIMA